MEDLFLPYVRSCTTEKVALIVDNLASHTDVVDDQLLFIALPPNTTAVFQPLDAGIIQALKMRYKRRYLSSMVAYRDNLDEQQETTRVTAALNNSGRVSLLDVARIISEEWAGSTAESIVRCWIKAKCLPAPMEAAITSMYADYHRTDTPQVSNQSEEITHMLRQATLTDGLFPDSSTGDVESGVSAWLNAEADAEILSDTIDMVLEGGESEGEED